MTRQNDCSEAAGRRGHNTWTQYINQEIAREISTVTWHYDRVIQWMPRDHDSGFLFSLVQSPDKLMVRDGETLPDCEDESSRTAILLNGTLNHQFDIQALLVQLKARLCRTSRLLVVLYNPYLRFIYRLANGLGLRRGEIPTTFVTRVDLQNLAKLAGFEVIRQRNCVYFPWRWMGIGSFINRGLSVVPFVRWLALAHVVVLRPILPGPRPGLSCIVPARNERGNIENALKRFPDLGCPVEIIFVEGHSSDGTWEEIQRVAGAYGDRFRIRTFQQEGKGKGDAVRLGFAKATEALVTILDADLTMPPELLRRFYDAYCEGHGDFVNGSRLVYPMEGEAMRFLNRLGNVFFAKALSWVLDTPLSDSLCGTKLLARRDYERIKRWRAEFGDFDPFGDFELLFPAAVLGFGIVDVPVRYLARTYGATNIHRFSHGFQLLRMTLIGFIRIKLGAVRKQRHSQTGQ